MAYLLDSDVVIDYLIGNADIKRLVDTLAAARISISTITYMEVYQGILEGPDPAATRIQFEIFLARVPTIPPSLEIAHRCAEIRSDLKRRGKRVRPRVLDLIIAATALEHDLTLVTRNKADYNDIPNLVLY